MDRKGLRRPGFDPLAIDVVGRVGGHFGVHIGELAGDEKWSGCEKVTFVYR
jgi:hypothetical protein